MSDRLNSLEKIRNVAVATIAEQLFVDVAEVTPEKKFMDDLGCDSLDMVELTMALEDECSVEITDEEVDQTVTVQNAIDLLSKKLNVTA